MNSTIPSGVWPTMLTPFTDSNEVDYCGLEAMIEWYIEEGVDGLFAVCLSSEMFHLTLEERIKISRFVKECAGKRVPVVASGHISDNFQDQIYELKAISDTGIDALVIVSNRLAKQDQDDDIWKLNAEKLLREIPEISLGIYECPYPYRRLMTPELLEWCASTKRFYFLKDTCCDLTQLKSKSQVVKGSKLKIFNANSATLLDSLKMGIAGFSGVMANFHPDLYVWLTRNWNISPHKATILQGFLGISSLIEGQYYPVSGKYHMQLCGIDIKLNTRNRSHKNFTQLHSLQVKQLKTIAEIFRDNLQIDDK